MNVSQMAKLGGIARAKSLTAARRKEIARLGAIAAKESGKRLGRPPKIRHPKNNLK